MSLVVRDLAPEGDGLGFLRYAGHELGQAGAQLQPLGSALVPAVNVSTVRVGRIGLCEGLDPGGQLPQLGDIMARVFADSPDVAALWRVIADGARDGAAHARQAAGITGNAEIV